MKTSVKIFATAAVALTAAALIVSCKSKTAAPPVPPTFNTLTENRHMAASAGNFELSYNFEYISEYSDPTVLEKIRSAMTTDFFGSEYTRADVAASAAAFNEAKITDHGTQPGGEFKWDGYLKLHSKASVVKDRIISYTIQRSEDTGGAHVMDTEDNVNYDLTTGNRLTLNDLFTPEGKAALGDAVRAQILKDKGVATWQELVDRDCFNAADAVTLPGENFSLTATAITFVYNPYDIACYAAGSTRVTLPLANLQGVKF